MIKLIASDLDGTLLQNGATEIAPSVFALIRTLKDSGIVFAVASGRQYHNLRLLFEPVKDEIAYICENGAVVVYQGKVIYNYEFPKQLRNEIVKKIMEHEDTEVLASSMEVSYIQPKDMEFAALLDSMGNKNESVEDLLSLDYKCCKIAMYNKNGVEQFEDYFKKKLGEEVHVVTSGTLWLDVLMPGVNKATGMMALEEVLGITKEQVMAFGDNDNDIEMLEHVGYSVAVENAKDSVKRVSRYTTDTVKNKIEAYLKEAPSTLVP